MKRFEKFLKTLLCKHDYEFISSYIKTNKGKAKHYDSYECVKCKQRKEFGVK